MREIRTEIEIAATPDLVWKELTAFDRFPEWNPFIRRAEGDLAPGSQLKVYFKPPKGMGMTVKLRVVKAEPNTELRWLGHFVFPALFEGEHYFLIDPHGDDSTHFVQGEHFTGFLVPLLGLMGLFKNTTQGFEQMNEALKSRCEQLSGS